MRTFRASSRALLFHHFVTTISPFQGLHDALWVVYTVVFPFFFLVGICLQCLVELLGGLPPYADLAPKQSVTARPIHGPVFYTSIWFYWILFDIIWSRQLFQVFGDVGNLQSLLILHFHCISFHSCLRKLRRNFSGANQSLANMPCFNSPLLAAFCKIIAACLLVTN